MADGAQRMPKPKRVIGPRLRILLIVVLALFTLLSANGVYLFAITWLETLYWPSLSRLLLPDHVLVPSRAGTADHFASDHLGVMHMLAARHRRNRRAVRIGYALFA